MARFNDVIETREQFRQIMAEPHEVVTAKTMTRLDQHCGAFIQRSPFLLLSSVDADGNVDVSPKSTLR